MTRAQPGVDAPGSRVVCAGCGLQAADEQPFPFRCAAAHTGAPGDVDHVMTVALDAGGDGRLEAGLDPGQPGSPHAGDAHPFVRFRALHHAWRMARRRGLADSAYVDLVYALDQRVARVWGHGFAVTPYARGDALAGALGLAVGPAAAANSRAPEPPARGGLWLADETGGVAGSHKARHLMGLAVYIEAAMRVGLAPATAPRLAIASCGNAALAAAVIAAAARWPLEVFVPTWADAAIVAQLRSLGAEVIACPRSAADPPGDPAYHRFVAAVSRGALPFACQGNQNGLTIQGGQTLGWELVARHAATGAPLDRILVQVGGGALASSVAQAFAVAHALGAVPRRPALHAVQAVGCHPLRRAWRRAAEGVHARLGHDGSGLDDAALARWIAGRMAEAAAGATASAAPSAAAAGAVAAEMATARAHRSRYMWPWETEPRSVATGILDDETYDWAAIVEAMLVTGGWPLVAEEADLVSARDAIGRAAGVATDATGAAGVAGLMVLGRTGGLDPGEHVAALVTGAAHKLRRREPAQPGEPGENHA